MKQVWIPWRAGRCHLLPVVLVLLLLMVAPVLAHPPSAMSLSYNMAGRELSVDITHIVNDPQSHYIQSVEIRVNNTYLSEFTYSDQPDAIRFTKIYPVSAEAGDTIRVAARCNQFGSLTEQIGTRSEAIKGAAKTVPVLWPYHAGLMVTGFIALLVSALSAGWWRKGHWYRAHKWLAYSGAVLFSSGVGIALYMVAESGGPHLRVIHGISGATGAALVFIALFIGITRSYVKPWSRLVRTVHLWIGWLMIVLAIVSIATGLVLVSK